MFIEPQGLSLHGERRTICRRATCSHASQLLRSIGIESLGMVDLQVILSVCAQIVRHCRPQKVILFGSYASGSPSKDSDIDLLVIMPFEGSPYQKAGEVRSNIDHRFPMDLIVYTPEYVQKRIALDDGFMRDILEKGRVLYDAALAGVGSESRG